MKQAIIMLFTGVAVSCASLYLAKYGAPQWLTYTTLSAGAITMFTSLFLAVRF
jgi:hypothetical protein